MERALTYATLDDKGKKLYRLFEYLPASLVWTTFVAAVILSFLKPVWAVYFIIAFDLYWFFRVLYFVIFLTTSWRRHRKALETDWLSELKKTPGWEKLVHLIFLPTYKEELPTIRATFEALTHAKYPTDRMIVVLGGEERGGREEFLERAEAIRKEYGDKFLRFIVTVHPDNIEGEMKSKGANMASMAGPAKSAIDELKIPYGDVIVTAFDVDTVAHPQYFAYLAKTYLETPDREHCSYQPVVLYSNNIWEANPVVRISAFGTTFWLLSELVRPERLFTFSSHSMPFQALVDVGFWQKDLVSEDSRIFLQCFIYYGGNYRVVPMYVPVSMDAVMAPNTVGSLVNLYKQQRRWAWGVEHFPYLAVNFLRTKTIPLKKRLSTMWLLTEGMYTWATAPVLMFLLGWLPLLVARRGSWQDAVFQTAPHTLQIIMTLAMLGVFASAILSLPLLPPRPEAAPKLKSVVMLLQWLLLPFTFVLFGALPAIEAQTRLALGKKFHLGFWVTPKIKKP